MSDGIIENVNSVPEVVGRIDPRVQLDKPKEFQINFGGRQYTMNAQACQGGSNTGTAFNWNPVIPAPNINLVRTMYTVFQFDGTFVPAAIAQQGLFDLNRPIIDIGTTDGPRFLPTMQATTSVNLSLNGVQFNIQNDPLPLMAKFWVDQADSSEMLSTTPSMHDYYSDYAKYKTFGQARNPLGRIGEGTRPGDNRGGFIGMAVVNNPSVNTYFNTTDAKTGLPIPGYVSIVDVSPVFIPPLTQKSDAPSLSQIKNMQLTYNMTTNLNRVWCRAPPVTDGGSVTNVFYQSPTLQTGTVAPTQPIGPLYGSVVLASLPNFFVNNNNAGGALLLYMTITPQEGFALPRMLQFDYSTWLPNYTDFLSNLIAPSGPPESQILGGMLPTQNIVSGAYTLNAVPDELYIWVTHTQNSKTSLSNQSNTLNPVANVPRTGCYLSDVACRITSLQISFNNDVSLLQSQFANVGNQTNQDHFFINAKSGLIGSFNDYSGHAGSLYMVKPGIDFGLPPGIVPGMTGSWMLQVQVTYENISDCSIQASLVVTPRTFGVVTIIMGQISQNIGVVREDMVKKALTTRVGSYMSPFAAKEVGMGGDFFGSIKKFGVHHIVPHLTWANAEKAARFLYPHAKAAYGRYQASKGRKMGAGLHAGDGAEGSHEELGEEFDEDGEGRKDFRHSGGSPDDHDPRAGIPRETDYERASAIKRRRQETMDYDGGRGGRAPAGLLMPPTDPDGGVQFS